MITDNYTKFILTVICLCPVYLCVRDIVIAPNVRADEPVRVMLMDGHGRVMGEGMPLRVHVEE